MKKTVIISFFAAALMLAASCGEDTIDPVPQPPVKEEFKMSEAPEHVPVMEIMTDRQADIVSKEEYLRARITIKENNTVTLQTFGNARGRGNYTWDGYPKKPYKIKLDEKHPVCGMPANKDWVLLSDYCDKSLLRTAYMCDISEALQVDYPVRYRHVHLYLNGEYKGVYLLTDQIEKKKHRVDIADDGFLFENDNYAWAEPLRFVTAKKGYQFSFKYPDPEDGEIVEGDDNYYYILRYMNSFEEALYGDNFKDPATGYRKYIDVESFAKWYIVAELTANHDPNMYYVMPHRGAKLKKGPLWDSEWSLGTSYRGGPTDAWAVPPRKPDPHQVIWGNWKYFGRLFQDPYFKEVVKKEWEEFKPRIPMVKEKLEDVAACINEAQAMNFARWPVIGTYLGASLICLGSWEEEVQYNSDFLDERVRWMDDFLL